GVAAQPSRPGDAPVAADAAPLPGAGPVPGTGLLPGETALVALAPPKAVFRAPGQDSDLDRLIARYAAEYGVPEALVRRVIQRESRYNPAAYNKGHWGLMQIKHATARGMGYRGEASGLLDAETNLKYSVKYLRGAWLVAGGNHDRADRFYQTGYYYDAKRMGLLDETGLGRDRVRKRRPG
ncbi:MAG: lytic transglycosylase domain-containing protein, partial [Mesorhizobium sp.]|nr:lytic transglycosylase domain-containing protein [Mesorhizobium sp.]